jgi:Family of unknown function (DUF6448)
MQKPHNKLLVGLALAGFLTFMPAIASAHCDTMDGPVVAAAASALRTGDIKPALIWIKPEYEKEVRSAFLKASSVRKQGEAAKELADNYFFETVVRLHRMGEGEPYTGIKPSGTPLHPAVAAAEKALSTGSTNQLRTDLNDKLSAAVAEKFARVVEAGRHRQESVEAGRAYVAAYVEFMHFVEQVYDRSTGTHAEAAGSHTTEE